jgi:hypothetical protein
MENEYQLKNPKFKLWESKGYASQNIINRVQVHPHVTKKSVTVHFQLWGKVMVLPKFPPVTINFINSYTFST